MPPDVRHLFVSPVAAGTSNRLVQGPNWNEAHNLQQGPAALLGRSDSTPGQAATQEVLLDPATMAFVGGKLAALASGGGSGLTPEAVTAAFTVLNLAALKALPTRPAFVVTQGYYTANDGGGGPPWQWVAGSTATADDFMVATPASGPAGRYIRQFQAGAGVCPKWAGCGLGAADDTARFQVVVNYGSPIDMSNCTVPLGSTTITIPPSVNGQLIFSDGSGVFTVAAAATSATYMFNVTKSDFAFDNLFFNGPYTGSPTVAPQLGRFINFQATAPAFQQRSRVSRCRFYGSTFHISGASNSSDVTIENCTFDNSMQEAVLIVSPVDCVIENNVIRNCAFDSGGISSAGLRIDSSVINQAPARITVNNNTVYRCGVANLQEGIDISGGALYQITVTGNKVIECGNGGFECKTYNAAVTFTGSISGTTLSVPGTVTGATGIFVGMTVTGTGVAANTVIMSGSGTTWTVNNSQTVASTAMTAVVLPDTYSFALFANNIVRLDPAHVGIGFNFHLTSAPAPAGKAAVWQIIGNTVACDTMPGTSTSLCGVTLTGYVDTAIQANSFLRLERGIVLSAEDGGDNTQSRTRIVGNTIDVSNYGIIGSGTTAGTLDGLRVVANEVRAGVRAFGMFGPTVTNAFVGYNRFESTTNTAVEFRSTTGTRFVSNDVAAAVNCVSQSVAGDVIYIDNTMITTATNQDAFSISAGTATLISNKCVVPAARNIYSGAGTVTASGNTRGTATANPTGTLAGSLNDIVANSTPSTGIKEWICTTAGAVGGAVYQPMSMAVTTSAGLRAQITDETGTGALVFADTPTMVTPLLGTPTSGNLANCTGFPAASLGGLGAGVGTWLATPSSANLATAVTGETGSGALVFATSPTMVTPLLGTPTSGNLSNCTAYPAASLGGLGAAVGTWLATPSSANLAAAVTDETGSGALVFANTPTLVTPVLGVAGATSVRVADGTAAAPSLSFTSTPAMGFFMDSSGNPDLALVVGGKRALVLGIVGTSNNRIRITSNNTPMITAVEGAGGNQSLGLSGAGTAGVEFYTGTTGLAFAVTSAGTVANYVQVAGQVAGTGPQIQAVGSDTNIDLMLQPKGTGVMRVNNAGNFAANATVATTMTSLGPTGSRTTIQKWLTIKDNAGNPFYIPCF